jgi:hypothetical protein
MSNEGKPDPDYAGYIQIGQVLVAKEVLRCEPVEVIAGLTNTSVDYLLELAAEELAPLGLTWAPKDTHSCEKELRARPDWDVFLGTPDVFHCSCGETWAYVHSEAEGAWWERTGSDP